MNAYITKEKAFEIVREFIDELTLIDQNGILALYLIGSLGGGYYRPGQSDIDTVIIVKNDARITQNEIDEVADIYQKRYCVPKGFGSVMIQERELFSPYTRSEIEEFEFCIEIARLKTQGLLFYGDYSLDPIPMPTAEHIIKDAIIMENWLHSEFGYPMYKQMDVTACINCILQTMRRFLMIEHGVFEFNKFKTIDAYLRFSPAIVDNAVFAFIHSYLLGEASGDTKTLDMLRAFGTRISDHYNKELLGLIFH